jgi:acetylornithine deacetylase
MNLDKREQRIIDSVNGLKDDILDFACRLVAEASTLGNETSALTVMEDELKRLSFAVTRVPIDAAALSGHPGFGRVPWTYENKYNLVGRRYGTETGGRSLLLNGHLDVVDPGSSELWNRDPFRPEVRDGWLYGRGAGDMKSGVAAMTYAVHALEKAGFGLRAPVTVEAVVEEECTGNGALACILAGYDADAVMIPEPFGPTILTEQLGVLWFKVAVRGSPIHVLEATAGVNAVEKSFAVIAALRRLEAELNQAERPAAFAAMAHPLNLNIGIFNGGNWPSSVPAAAEFHGRLSYFPGVSYAEICAKITRTVMQAAEEDPWLSQNPPSLEFYGFRSEGHRVSRELPALKLLNECHRATTGEDAREYAATCTTDLRAFHFFGRGQATCYGPVAENIHGANERVSVGSVLQVAHTYALFMARWCGLTE